jgi:hypothetical protein
MDDAGEESLSFSDKPCLDEGKRSLAFVSRDEREAKRERSGRNPKAFDWIGPFAARLVLLEAILGASLRTWRK